MDNNDMETKVKTKISTKTKVLIAVLIIGLLAAAIGLGLAKKYDKTYVDKQGDIAETGLVK